MGRGKKLIPLFLGLASVVLALVAHFITPTLFQGVGNLLFDEYQRRQPREFIDVGVRVIDIDDESLNRLGQWPWARTTIAEITQRLAEAGAVVISYDIVFSEADRTSPSFVVDRLKSQGVPSEQTDFISRFDSHDDILGATISNLPVVTGYFMVNSDNGLKPPTKWSMSYTSFDEPIDLLTPYFGATPNLPVIDEGASGSGFVSVANIEGGIIRKAPMLLALDDTAYPALSLETLRVALGGNGYIVKTSAGSGELGAVGGQELISKVQIISELCGIDMGNGRNLNCTIPTTGNGEFFVHYTEDEPIRKIPAWKVIDPDTSMEELTELVQGTILLIAPSAAGLLDLRSTPMNPIEPGVLIHAQMVEQMILGQFLEQPYSLVAWKRLIVLVGGVILVLLLSLLGAIRGGVVTILGIGGVMYLSWWAYTEQQVLFDPIYPAAALLFSAMVTIISSFYMTESERSEIKGAFDRYLSPDMVEKIADDPSLLTLGGEERDLTILFCDIRSFSKISEKLTPQELTTFLNNFLTPMTDILMDNKSTIDKYIGDAIMSFWNAPLDDPDHHANAARGALYMIWKLEEMNEIFRTDPDNAPLPVETSIGIGLNSGLCSVGNMGSEQRFAYSVLGDAVNLSSRLEGLTKQYGVHIIIGEQTAAAIPEFARAEIDKLRVVGRETPETIFVLVGEEDTALTENYKKFESLQKEFMTAYREQRWDDAETIADEAKFYAGEYRISAYYDKMKDRIAQYRKNPPGDNWDGIYQASSK